MSRDPREMCRQVRRCGLASRWDAAPGLGLALVSGPEGAGFLQARLTSDVHALAPGEGHLSAKLTGRGQLVGYFSLHRLPDRGQPFPTYFILANRDEIPGLLKELEATRINEDVLLEDVSAQFEGVLIQGPETGTAVDGFFGQSGLDEEPEFTVRVPDRPAEGLPGLDLPADLLILSRSFTGDPGRLLLWGRGSSGPDSADRYLEALAQQDLVVLDPGEVSCTAWTWLTIEAGWPRLGRDLEPSQIVLSQTGLEQQVVHASKGCFPGQEVVARIRTYGSVPYALRGLEFGKDEAPALEDLPAVGSELKVAGKKVGTWATGAWSVTRERMIALVFLDRDHRIPGTSLRVKTETGTAAVEVVHLPFFRGADRRQRAEHLHAQAIGLFSGGDDQRAVALLEEALRLDPGLHDAYEALGVILGRTEQYLQAIDVFRRLEEVAPLEPMVHTNLSLFYMKIGDKEEAERQQAQATLKRFAPAGDSLEARALEDAATVTRLQEARRKIGMFSAVLEIDPADPLALTGLGKALAELEDYEGAVEHLTSALSHQADNSALYAACGKVLEALGRFEEAAEIYRQGIAVASRRGDLMPLRDMESRLGLLGI